MHDYYKQVNYEYEKWKNSPPNIVQKSLGFATKPIEFLLKPFINKIAPLLENTIKSINDYIAKAIKKISRYSNDYIEFDNLNENQFLTWLKKQDKKTKHLVTAGVVALTAEGAATGLGGFALLSVDIPASFGLILTFSDIIALTYQLDIYDEDIQVEIIKAITIGSETTIEGKLEAITTLRIALKTITTTTWKGMSKAPIKTMPGLIHAIRSLLKKLGINITKRKATQLIPGLGAIAGGTINGSWGLDSLEAVRQIARKMVIQAYKKNK